MDPKEERSWFYKSWRPAVAWAYLFLCLFDFFVAPIMLGAFCYFTGVPYIPWEPLTIKGGSALHISMGGIAGVSAWSRGKEKIVSMEIESSTKMAETKMAENVTDKTTDKA
jgi:hypothetical protein